MIFFPWKDLPRILAHKFYKGSKCIQCFRLLKLNFLPCSLQRPKWKTIIPLWTNHWLINVLRSWKDIIKLHEDAFSICGNNTTRKLKLIRYKGLTIFSFTNIHNVTVIVEVRLIKIINIPMLYSGMRQHKVIILLHFESTTFLYWLLDINQTFPKYVFHKSIESLFIFIQICMLKYWLSYS